ncbi:hypothetical protein DB347_06460 [Opitutaceae bacterium EW11]|nr:hypothetical protein DB347_06460 [Opitutaceae bacterium EW11]
MRKFHRGLASFLILLAAAGATRAASELPSSVSGLRLQGVSTRAVRVAVRDASGRLRSEALPAIAVLRSTPWSPADPVRDGAREFEVLLTVASLLRQHALAGVVTVGNRNGRVLPEAEQALRRTSLMGVPVVKVAPNGQAPVDPENVFIEAGSLSEAEARQLLADCLLRFGNLPPCADASRPTESELAAIQDQIARYQTVFSAAEPGSLASVR